MQFPLKRWLEFGGLVALTTFILWRGVIPSWNTVHSDFANYYVSSSLVVEKAPLDSLYNNAWFQRQIDVHDINADGKFAPFPPATAWLMIPLTSFSPLTAQRIWTCCNLFFIALCILLVRRITKWSTTHSVLFILAGGLGLANNIAFGQIYILLLVSMLYAFIAEAKNQPPRAGFLLGFFTIVKYFPASMVLGYLLSGRYRVVVASVLSGAALILLQWVVFGTDIMVQFVTSIFLPHLNGDLGSQGPYTFNFQSWDGLLTFMFVKDPVYNPVPVIDWPMAKAFIKIIVSAIVLSSAAILVVKARAFEEEKKLSVTVAAITMAALVLLPASATYHFVLLVFPLALLFKADVLSPRAKILAIVIYTIIGFIPYGITTRLGHTYGLVFGFPRLWLITALYSVIFISLFKPEFFRKEIA